MRKSPTISPRQCVACGTRFTPTGTAQKYCTTCRETADVQRKREWYVKNNPGAYAEREKHFCSACGEPAESRLNCGEWYCNLHWQRMNHHGTLDKQVHKSKNTFIPNGDVVLVRMKRNFTMVVSASDLEKIKSHSWCVDPRGYAVANIHGKVTPVHRYLISPPEKMVVDHINGNRLDNRRSNLRICSFADNSRNKAFGKNNTSGFTGIRLLASGKYQARIMVNRKQIHIGNYDTIEDAVSARIEAESTYFKEFAPSISRL